MKKGWNTVFLAVMVVVILLVLIFVGDYLGLEADVATDFATFLPGLVFFVGGATIMLVLKGIYLFPGSGIIGIGIAILFETMYDQGYITAQMMSGLTIGQIQMWCIIIMCLAGGLMSAISLKGRN